MLFRHEPEANPAIHNINIKRILADHRARLALQRQRHFIERNHRLHIHNRKPSQSRADTRADHDRAALVPLRVPQEPAVLVVDIARRVPDHRVWRGEDAVDGRRRELPVQRVGSALAARHQRRLPRRGVARAPVQRRDRARRRVDDDAAKVVLVLQDLRHLVRVRVDPEERGGRVGAILGGGDPQVPGRVLQAAEMILRGALLGQGNVVQQSALAVVHQQLRPSRAVVAIRAVDPGVAWELDRWLRPDTHADHPAVLAHAHHALWLVGVALHRDGLDEVPGGAAAEVGELLDDCVGFLLGEGAGEGRVLGKGSGGLGVVVLPAPGGGGAREGQEAGEGGEGAHFGKRRLKVF